MSRFDTDFGDDGLREDRVLQGDMTPYGARYRFAGRTFGIVVWARSREGALEHCASHGLVFDGEIVGIVKG